MTLDKSLQALIDLHDDPFYEGNHPNEKQYVDSLLSPFNTYSFDVDKLCIHKKILYYIMRVDTSLPERYRRYRKSVEPVSDFIKKFSSEHSSANGLYSSYTLADKTELTPIGSNTVRINFNRRFARNLSVSETRKVLQDLQDANLLVKYKNMYLLNFPYIIRATTSFGLKNADSNITTKQN